MTAIAPFLIELTLLTLAYWCVDAGLRREGLAIALERVRLGSENAWVLISAGLGAAFALVGGWNAVPDGNAIRILATALAALMAWKAATKDIDIVTGEAHDLARLVLIVSALAVPFSPGAVITTALLLTTPFGLWEHHSTMPMRMLQATMAQLLLFALAPVAAYLPWASVGGSTGGLFADASMLAFFLVVVQVSHYLITAVAKGFLGPRPWSWITDNQIHHLSASAYSWGWGRWLSWERYAGFLRLIRVMEKPMQASAFLLELLAPLALLHRDLALFFCLLWSAFHVGVFLCSGLLFWDWAGANLAVLAMIWWLPEATTEAAFGGAQTLIALVFLVAFPLRHKLWTPIPLGWWDTPFTQRMRWRVLGESGKEYEVYNDFMCPNERLYGKVHACFLAPSPVCTYHLGECWKRELRDALRDAGADAKKLDEVRERYGIQPRDEALATQHRNYLRAFFGRLNGGARKHILPRGLRWLKAPGGQCFYWGELPAYRGQEPVTQVAIHYREEYFDGERLVRLRDEVIEEISIAGPIPEAVGPEPTPRQIDDFILSYAIGKLIDLPGFSDGFVRIDDGRSRARSLREHAS